MRSLEDEAQRRLGEVKYRHEQENARRDDEFNKVLKEEMTRVQEESQRLVRIKAREAFEDGARKGAKLVSSASAAAKAAATKSLSPMSKDTPHSSQGSERQPSHESVEIDGKTIHFAFSGGRPPRIAAGRDATPDGSELSLIHI